MLASEIVKARGNFENLMRKSWWQQLASCVTAQQSTQQYVHSFREIVLKVGSADSFTQTGKREKKYRFKMKSYELVSTVLILPFSKDSLVSYFLYANLFMPSLKEWWDGHVGYRFFTSWSKYREQKMGGGKYYCSVDLLFDWICLFCK